MNVLVEYLYRDAANYKSWGEVVFTNESELDLLTIDTRIRAALIDGEFFVAETAGVPVLYFEIRDEELDHQWHEYSAVKESNERVTGNAARDVSEFIAALKSTENTAFRINN